MKLRYSLLIILSLIFIACGEGPKGDKGDKGDQGPSTPTGDEETWIGEYYLPLSGFVIITVNHENEYSVDAQYQFLNPDDTVCALDLDASLIDLHSGKLVYMGTVAMAAGNCRSDANVALLTAAGVTYQYEIELRLESGNLVAELLIFQTSSGVRTLVIEKEISEI